MVQTIENEIVLICKVNAKSLIGKPTIYQSEYSNRLSIMTYLLGLIHQS